MGNDIPIPDYEEIKQCFDAAESYAKEIEVLQEDIAFPAINQLRYAGHHLLKALVAESPARHENNMLDARKHCQRSMYDASEAGITYILNWLTGFRERHSGLSITETIPDYPKVLVAARRAGRKLVEGRSNRKSPEDQTAEYMVVYRELCNFKDLLEAHEDDLIVRRNRELRENRRYVTKVALILLGILVSIVLAILRSSW